MKNNTFKVGEIYRVSFGDKWSSKESMDVKITGTTNSSESAGFVGDSIYDTYFGEFNLDLADYVNYIKDETVIYICDPVKTKFPVEFEGGTILVPSTVIDFIDSKEYITVDDMDVTIKGLTKYFETTYKRGKYATELIGNVKKSIRGLREFGDLPISVSVGSEDHIILIDEYTEADNSRAEHFILADKAATLKKTSDDVQHLAIVKKSEELRIKEDSLDTIINSSVAAKVSYDTHLSAMSGSSPLLQQVIDGDLAFDDIIDDLIVKYAAAGITLER
jgi:hypothetical protein